MATQLLEAITSLDEAVLTPFAPGLGLPLFVQPATPRLASDFDYARDWFLAGEAEIDTLLDDAGALVFRGFPVNDSHAFGRMVEHYGSPAFGYTGGQTPRGQIAPMVYEATKVPPNQRITLHQEMAYMPTFPERLAFYCRMPSVEGGETLLGDMRRLTEEIDSALLEKIGEYGVLYTRIMRDRDVSTGSAYFDVLQRTWQDGFDTEDRETAEARARAAGLDPEWLDDGGLAIRYRGPGLIQHPRTNERVWFNQLQTLNLGPHNTADFHTYEEQFDRRGKPRPFTATLGDGTPLATDEVLAIADAMNRCSVAFPWSSGDMLLIDNYRAAHGRNPFTGERDVQVALLN